MVGNDIIDLHHFESPPYHALGYLERVTVPLECNVVRRSRDQVATLSTIWAAKEAAFKLLFKEGFTAHFLPRQFEVTLSTEPLLPESVATVAHGSRVIHIRVRRTHEWVHAIATPRSSHLTSSVVEEIHGNNSHVPSPLEESLAARRIGKRLLNSLGEPRVVLAYSGRVPFLALANGTAADLDISFSHHGRFAAAVAASPEAQLADHSILIGHSRTFPAVEESCCTCMV